MIEHLAIADRLEKLADFEDDDLLLSIGTYVMGTSNPDNPCSESGCPITTAFGLPLPTSSHHDRVKQQFPTHYDPYSQNNELVLAIILSNELGGTDPEAAFQAIQECAGVVDDTLTKELNDGLMFRTCRLGYSRDTLRLAAQRIREAYSDE